MHSSPQRGPVTLRGKLREEGQRVPFEFLENTTGSGFGNEHELLYRTGDPLHVS
jgi:hypothetical protein